MEFLYEWLDIIKAQFLLHPYAQSIGIIAFFIAIYNFLFCRDRKFIIVTAIMSAFWGVHYIGIGALSAGFINLFDVFKNLAGLKWERNKKWMYFFIFSYIGIGIFTFAHKYFSQGLVTKDFIEIIPVLLWVVSTYLVFFVRGLKLKIGFFITIFFWLAYNVISGSIGWATTDIFIFFSSIIGITKDILSDKREKEIL